MSEYTVWFSTPAEAAVTVQADDPDDAIEKAYNDLPGSLCHQCAHDYQVGGEWEPDVVLDGDSNEVWRSRERLGRQVTYEAVQDA